MGVRFRGDRRAVSEVVGAILLLGILILALTSYQAAVVPNQNAQTEFQHNLQVEDEMVELRNALLEARSSGTETFAAITLGTQYRDRIFAINPPPATGTLQTVQQDNISVTEGGGQEREDPLRLDDRPLENQFIEYTPRYSEYQSAGTIRYENTVTYHQYPTANVTLTSQRLLQDDRVTLAPIEGTVSESGIRRVTVDPIPGVLQTTKVEDPEIVLPTELSGADWNRTLDNELSEGESALVEDGFLTLNLKGTYEIAYSPVGANRAPREGTRGSSAGEINPAAPGNVQLISSDWDSGSDRVTLRFRNSAEDSSFTSGRVNFYFTASSSGNKPTGVDEIRIIEGGSIGPNLITETWTIGADFNDLSPPAVLPGDGEITSIRMDFEGNVRNNDFFVVTFILETGETATYFVGDGSDIDDGDDEEDTNLQVTSVGGGANNEVPFSIENTGTGDAVVEGISVDDTTDPQADRVRRDGGNEFERTDGGGGRDGTIFINGDQVNLDTEVTIEAGAEADFFLGQFRDSNGNLRNMGGDDVTITLYLSDGTEQELILQN